MPRKEKDPNKPKGPLTAYACFVKNERELLRKKGQEVEFTHFSKQCSDKWKHYDDDDKKKFVAESEIDRGRYDKELAVYKPAPGFNKKGLKTGGKKGKKIKDPRMPKRGMSAFFWFSCEKRPKLKEQNPDASVGDIAKQLGAAWKMMTEEQKAPYQKSADEDRKRYAREMEQYKKKGVVEPEEDDEEEEEDEEGED